MSQATVRQVLKKTLSAPAEGAVVPWATHPQYRPRMDAVLDLYARPDNLDEPMVCVDEKGKQLLAPKQPALPIKPGKASKVAYEYERQGTRNLFVVVEPLAGGRQVQVTPQRKKADFVHFMRQ